MGLLSLFKSKQYDVVDLTKLNAFMLVIFCCAALLYKASYLNNIVVIIFLYILLLSPFIIGWTSRRIYCDHINKPFMKLSIMVFTSFITALSPFVLEILVSSNTDYSLDILVFVFLFIFISLFIINRDNKLVRLSKHGLFRRALNHKSFYTLHTTPYFDVTAGNSTAIQRKALIECFEIIHGTKKKNKITLTSPLVNKNVLAIFKRHFDSVDGWTVCDELQLHSQLKSHLIILLYAFVYQRRLKYRQVRSLTILHKTKATHKIFHDNKGL